MVAVVVSCKYTIYKPNAKETIRTIHTLVLAEETKNEWLVWNT